MPRPRPLSPEQAKRTLVHRFAPRADRLRQIAVRFGVRPYRVHLVWTRWSGRERGDGTESEVARIEVLPTPMVKNLDTVAYRFFSGGVLPVGSISVTRISALYTQDQLTGLAVPTPEFAERNDPPRPRSADELPPKPSDVTLLEPLDFYWLVQEDGRGDDPPVASKFRLAAWPFRNASGLSWEVVLERVSSDPDREGRPTSGFDET